MRSICGQTVTCIVRGGGNMCMRWTTNPTNLWKINSKFSLVLSRPLKLFQLVLWIERFDQISLFLIFDFAKYRNRRRIKVECQEFYFIILSQSSFLFNLSFCLVLLFVFCPISLSLSLSLWSLSWNIWFQSFSEDRFSWLNSNSSRCQCWAIPPTSCTERNRFDRKGLIQM